MPSLYFLNAFYEILVTYMRNIHRLSHPFESNKVPGLFGENCRVVGRSVVDGQLF